MIELVSNLFITACSALLFLYWCYSFLVLFVEPDADPEPLLVSQPRNYVLLWETRGFLIDFAKLTLR